MKKVRGGLVRCTRNAVLMVLAVAAIAIASSAQQFTTVASFDLSNGLQPGAALILGADGNFYGTTEYGGNLTLNSGYGYGTVFRMTPSGAITTLHSFTGLDGEAPYGLVQGTDGNFYGTTFCSTLSQGEAPSLPRRDLRGGTRRDEVFLCEGPGSVYRISPSGTFVTLRFLANPANGLVPSGALVEGSDGNLYGEAGDGGANSEGTIYKITPSGTLTPLYSFCSQPGCTDGASPFGSLVRGSDGNFYGTTDHGGNPDCDLGFACGTVFKITPSGTLTTLHSFSGPDGDLPLSGAVQGSDGNFYGTTSGGGSYNDCPNSDCGTVFRVTPSGTLTTLYNFSNADGASPNGLVQASDGNFYGTTYTGGTGSAGTVFRITPTGLLSTLHSFCSEGRTGCADGEGSEAGLVQGADGMLYGTTLLGGNSSGPNGCNNGVGCGTVFRTSATSSAYQFVPMAPCLLWDTRGGGPLQGGTPTTFEIPSLSQAFGCGDLTSATAYSLNVTVVPRGPLGYLTLWATGENQPNISVLNSPDGRVKAGAAIVAAGYQGYLGAVTFYASDTTDFILYIDGYFTTPGEQTLQFYPLAPCRIVDTRNGQDGGTLQAGVERDYPIAGNCGVPSGAGAYSLNVTVLPAPGGLDYLTVWPQSDPQQLVSMLNDYTGTVVANAAIVAAGNNQTTAFYAHSNNTDLLVDVNGYFAAPGAGGYSLYTIPPCRAYDSRNNNGQPFMGERTVSIASSQCAPPGNAAAYVFNATVVPSGVMPYLTLWPDSEGQPVVSTLNAYDGFITSNMAIVPNVNGSIDTYAAGLTQLILDISGYFAQ